MRAAAPAGTDRARWRRRRQSVQGSPPRRRTHVVRLPDEVGRAVDRATRSAGISTITSPSSSSGPRSTSSRSARRSTAGWTIALSAGCSARWVNGEKARTCSISSPKSSTRSGSRPVDGNTSTMPPRTANWPRSSTRSTRSYPASASCSVEPVDPRLVADPERERARPRGARRQPLRERRDRRADKPPGVEDVERPVALTDQVRRRDEPQLGGDAPARKEGDLRGVPEPRGTVGSVPRVGVLGVGTKEAADAGQQMQSRAAARGRRRGRRRRCLVVRDAAQVAFLPSREVTDQSGLVLRRTWSVSATGAPTSSTPGALVGASVAALSEAPPPARLRGRARRASGSATSSGIDGLAEVARARRL